MMNEPVSQDRNPPFIQFWFHSCHSVTMMQGGRNDCDPIILPTQFTHAGENRDLLRYAHHGRGGGGLRGHAQLGDCNCAEFAGADRAGVCFFRAWEGLAKIFALKNALFSVMNRVLPLIWVCNSSASTWTFGSCVPSCACDDLLVHSLLARIGTRLCGLFFWIFEKIGRWDVVRRAKIDALVTFSARYCFIIGHCFCQRRLTVSCWMNLCLNF